MIKYEWTKSHEHALYSSLENILPNELIYMIENYARYDMYLYGINIFGITYGNTKKILFHENINADIYYVSI